MSSANAARAAQVHDELRSEIEACMRSGKPFDLRQPDSDGAFPRLRALWAHAAADWLGCLRQGIPPPAFFTYEATQPGFIATFGWRGPRAQRQASPKARPALLTLRDRDTGRPLVFGPIPRR